MANELQAKYLKGNVAKIDSCVNICVLSFLCVRRFGRSRVDNVCGDTNVLTVRV